MKFTGYGVHLKVADLDASREFYEGLLGLKPSFAYGSDDFRASLPEGTASAPENYRGITYEVANGQVFEIAEDHIAVKNKNDHGCLFLFRPLLERSLLLLLLLLLCFSFIRALAVQYLYNVPLLRRSRWL